MNIKSYVLKLTSAISIEGVVLRAGELVEVVESDAKALLARGKAVLATVEDAVIGEKPKADGGKPDVATLAAALDGAKADKVAPTPPEEVPTPVDPETPPAPTDETEKAAQ